MPLTPDLKPICPNCFAGFLRVESLSLAIPPLANLFSFIAARLAAPSFATLLFLITNSPGVNIAGTVSLFPVPGTIPPLAKPLAFPKPFGILPRKLPKPLAALKATSALNNGKIGLMASPSLIKDSANVNTVAAITWNVVVSVILLTNDKNSSFTLVILTARDNCAFAASSVRELTPPCATTKASCATLNSRSNGITLPICLKPAISSAISINRKSPCSSPAVA